MAEEEAPDLDLGSSPEGDGSKYACETCGKQYANRAGLWKHKPKCVAETALGTSRSDQGEDAGTTKDGATKSETKPTRGERKPRTGGNAPRGKRHDCSHLLGPAWTQLARFVPSVPAQRAMLWQAPGAGRVLDNALAGTVVDKWVLQKVSGTESKYRPAIDLVSLPTMLILLDKQPALLPVIAPMLRGTIKANLEAALDAKAAEKAEDDKLRAKAEAAGFEWEQEVIDGETGQKIKVDLIDQIISSWFEDVPANAVPSPDAQ